MLTEALKDSMELVGLDETLEVDAPTPMAGDVGTPFAMAGGAAPTPSSSSSAMDI